MSISSSKLLASNRNLLEKSFFWWRHATFFYVGPEHGLSKKFANQFFTWSIYLSGDLPHGHLSYTLPSMMVSLMFPRIITHYMSKIFQNSMGYDCTQSNLHSKFVKDKNICALSRNPQHSPPTLYSHWCGHDLFDCLCFRSIQIEKMKDCISCILVDICVSFHIFVSWDMTLAISIRYIFILLPPSFDSIASKYINFGITLHPATWRMSGRLLFSRSMIMTLVFWWFNLSPIFQLAVSTYLTSSQILHGGSN